VAGVAGERGSGNRTCDTGSGQFVVETGPDDVMTGPIEVGTESDNVDFFTDAELCHASTEGAKMGRKKSSYD
jgi:hypothetical protein